MEINKGVEARKRQWGQHDFRFPCWLQSNWIMSRKMGSSWERAGAWTSESLALKTNSRRSKLKSFMGTGEASGLLVHKDLIADSRDIWAARANEQEVMEEGSALNSGQYIPFFFFCDLCRQLRGGHGLMNVSTKCSGWGGLRCLTLVLSLSFKCHLFPHADRIYGQSPWKHAELSVHWLEACRGPTPNLSQVPWMMADPLPSLLWFIP